MNWFKTLLGAAVAHRARQAGRYLQYYVLYMPTPAFELWQPPAAPVNDDQRGSLGKAA